MTDGMSFTVETHLLRELGDLLVGRDSTAIIELVKNSYDADATFVRLDASDLGDPSAAMLTVEDDGNGMTLNRFKTAFLRIAGRDKEQGFRRSPRYSRAYTGQKGIGRLASQKLANVLHVRSIPNSVVAAQEDLGVYACIDWKVIDQQDTSNELEQGLTVEPLPAAISASAGTVLSMSSLKRQWTRLEISRFVHEVRSAQPPPFIMSGDARSLGLVDEPLFGVPFARLSSVNDPGFSIAFMGEFEQGDDYWEQARLNFRWCVEVDVEGGRARV